MSHALFTPVVLTTHGPGGTQKLQGTVWGATLMFQQFYDIRVGAEVYQNIPAASVEKIGEPVVPPRHIWSGEWVEQERIAA